MGANQFMDVGVGKTVAEAFSEAVRQAAYDHGHSGYTGTIAEKPGYVLIPRPARVAARTVLETLQEVYDAEALAEGRYKWEGWKPNPRAEKAWKKLVEWYGKTDALSYARLFDSKWDECIAVEASPSEVADYKKRNKVGVSYTYVNGKMVETKKNVRNFHLFYFGGWASC